MIATCLSKWRAISSQESLRNCGMEMNSCPNIGSVRLGFCEDFEVRGKEKWRVEGGYRGKVEQAGSQWEDIEGTKEM